MGKMKKGMLSDLLGGASEMTENSFSLLDQEEEKKQKRTVTRKKMTVSMDVNIITRIQDAAYTLRMTQADFIENCVIYYLSRKCHQKIEIVERPENVRVKPGRKKK